MKIKSQTIKKVTNENRKFIVLVFAKRTKSNYFNESIHFERVYFELTFFFWIRGGFVINLIYIDVVGGEYYN